MPEPNPEKSAPRHVKNPDSQLAVTPFYIRRYPVPWGDYLRFARETGVGPYFVTFRSVIE